MGRPPEASRRQSSRRRLLRLPLLLVPLVSLLLLLMLPTPTAAVGAAAASTFVVSKPGGSSGHDPEMNSAAEQASSSSSSSLASALLPSSAPPSTPSSKSKALHVVEVFENQRWTALGGWQRPQGEGKVRPWTYEDGGESLDPQRLRLPDGFEWCGPWRVLRTNGTDAKGWRYANRAQNFDSHHSGRRQRIVSDRARRRRWVRPMRRAAVGPEGQGGEAGGVKQLRSVLLQGELDVGLGAGEAQDGAAAGGGGAGKAKGGGGDALLLLLLGEGDSAGAELLAPPERVDAAAVVEDGPLGGLLLLGHAVQQAISRARQDFLFKGFGLTFTKSLVRRDFGVGFGIPLTPNFPAWDRVEFLPTINSCVGVFWPFTISGWCSISYPADMVFRVLARLAPHIPSPASASANGDARYRSAATRAAAAAMADARRGLVATATAARARAKAATKGLKMAAARGSGGRGSSSSSSNQKKGGRRRRRGSVERVGISISCRYNPSTGFFVRVTPWLFILPGLQLLARLLARLFNFVLGRMEELESRRARCPYAQAQAREEQEQEQEKKRQEQEQEQEQEQQRALLASASARRFKKWLSKKTSGLGYTMALYRHGLGASVLVSLSPFFFGLRRPPRVANLASATALGTAQLLMDGPDDAATTAPAAAAVESIVVEAPVSEPLEPLLAAAAADGAGPVEEGQGEDEIPVPVLANGQEEEEMGEDKEPIAGDDKDRDVAAGAGARGDGATSQEDGGGASSSPSSSPAQADTQGGGGGGLDDQGAGANTIGVA